MTRSDQVTIGIAALAVIGLIAGVAAFDASVGPDPPPPPPGPAVSRGGPSGELGGQLIATISQGDRVEIGRYLVPGRRTVVEFTAGW